MKVWTENQLIDLMGIDNTILFLNWMRGQGHGIGSNGEPEYFDHDVQRFIRQNDAAS